MSSDVIILSLSIIKVNAIGVGNIPDNRNDYYNDAQRQRGSNSIHPYGSYNISKAVQGDYVINVVL